MDMTELDRPELENWAIKPYRRLQLLSKFRRNECYYRHRNRLVGSSVRRR
jgi:hypothetical protein